RLIELADQVASEPDEPARRPRWPYVAAAALAIVAVAGVGLALTGGDDEREVANADATPTSPAASAPTAAPTTEQPAATAPATTAPSSTAPASTQLATTTTAAPSTTAAPASTSPATTVPAASATTVPAATDDAIDQPVRWAEFSGGKVYLEGTVPDQATADEVRDKAGAVVGIDNVIVNYEIVAGAPRPPSAPLYVRDSVLFAKNSVDINSTARGVLDLGVVLMSQNPQITIDIEGHTDSDGSDEMNQALSQRRVDVIFDYLVSQGVDPSRLTKAAYGESRPIADNATADGRAKNRRVEFRINNLLG
ncbi:MAG: OmpA family protein, partial [Actinobacteria bacterium]|nr:OmpA family protein [Actinomycetota bacterium]